MKLVGHSNFTFSQRLGQAARQVMLALALALVAALGTYAIARAAVALSATMTDAILGDDGDGKADPGETIEYTVVINNSGSTDATGVEFDDNPDANTTFVGGSITASPVAVNDVYPETIVGNVAIDSSLISYKVVSNDYLGVNPAATITAFDATSTQGGQVSMTTSGANMGHFTYNPPTGYEGVDTFTYTLTDNPNATSAPSNRTATVTINISGMVWFINNNAANCIVNGCGRLSNPFSTLAAFNSVNDGVNGPFSNHPAANDNIFIYESATQYTGAITLLSGQKLIGQDATASLSTISGLTLTPSSSATFPAMNSGNGTYSNLGSTITLNTNATVRGLQVNSTTTTGINDPVGAISGVSLSEVSVTTSIGTAVQLSDVSGSLSFKSISANGAASGISLTNTSGSFTVTGTGSAGSGGTLQNISGSAISLTNTSGTSFSYMNLTTVGDNGVLGNGASGFTMSNSSLTNIGNTLTPDEAALNFTNLGGVSSFTGSTITNAIDDQVIVNQTGATSLTSFTLSGNTFNGHDLDNDAIRYQGYGTTNGTVSIQGNTFRNSDGDFIQVVMENSANLNLLVGSTTANSFSQPSNTALAGGITLSPGGGAGWNGRLDFDIANNTISSANAQAVNVNLLKPATAGATIDGFIRNNTISNSNNSFGGSIQVTNGGLVSQVTVEISGNTISGDNGTSAIYVIGDQGGTVSTGARTDIIVRNNIVSSPGAFNTNAVHLNSSTTSANTGTVVCWDMQGNTLAGGGFSGTDTRIRQRFSSQVLLPGYAGTSADIAAVQAYITARTNTGVVTAATQTPGGYYSGSCAQPTAKLLPDSGPSLASNPETDNGALASAIRLSSPSEGGSGKSLFAPMRPAPQQAGGIVNVVVGTLPAGKSVTIKFQATVNGPSLPLGTTQLSTQGTVSASNGTSTLTDDTAVGGASDPTTTPVDRPDTTVVSLNRASGNPTSNATVTWQVVFASAVDNLTASNFSLVQAGGVSGASITSVTETSGPPSTTWNITANTGSGDGTLGLNLANDSGLTHDVTNAVFTGQVYTIDRTPPTVTVNQAGSQADPAGSSPIHFTVVFNEPVTGFADGDVTLGGGANPTTAAVTEIAPNDGTTYDVAVSGMSGDGTVTASIGASVAQDAAGNGNDASTSTDNSVTYTRPADLSITKTDGVASATPGGNVTYTITASNAGPFADPAATVADTLPASLTANWTCVGAGGGTCTASGSGNLNDTVNLPVGGSVTYTVSAAISPSATGTLVNTATVASSLSDPDPANNSATDTDSLNPVADLAITKTDGATSVSPGGIVTYTITASNTGPSNAPSATVADTLPASLSGATWTCVGAGGGTCTAAGSGNLNQSVNLPAGGSVTFTVTATLDSGASGNLSNTATVSSITTDPAPGNNSATDSDTITPSADLSITKTDGVASATPGGSVTYTITASNAGPLADPAATVADTLPASLTANWTCVGAGGGTCTASGSGNINDTVNLPVGGSVTYTVSATISPSATGSLSNTATVTASISDLTPGNNSATDTDTLSPVADLSITKTDGVTTATPGGNVTYTITASNAGPSNAPSATVADTFPASLTANWTCVGAGGGTCTASGSGNLNDTVNLPVGGSVTYTVSATISPSATGTLSNTATVTSSVTDPAPGNNSATDTDTLNPQADLAIAKTDGATVAIPGGSVTYTITASNSGPSNAPGSSVADTLPASLSGASWTCVGAGGGTCTAAGSGNISDTVNLPAGGSVTYTVSATLSIAASGTLSNTATVSASGSVTDPAPANNSATDVDTIAPPVGVTIEQAGSQSDPSNASAIHFTVVFGSAVTDFNDPSDVTLGGTAGATTINITGGPTTYDVAVSGMTSDGTVTASIPVGAAQGSLGEPNDASTSTDNTVTYDGTAPTVTVEQAGGQLDPTGSSPIHFTVIFSEPVSGFATGDMTLGGGANPTTGTVTETAPNDGTTYDVAVSGMGGDGTVTASIGANQAQDAAGNGNQASTSTDNSVVYDTVPPSVTIEQAAGQLDPTNASTIHFTAVFTEPVTGFTNGDVTLGGTATPSAVSVTEIAPNDGTTYDVAVSGMANDGTVTADIPVNAAQDAGGNDNTASTSTDNTVTYDATAPTVTVEQASGQADPTNSGPIHFTVVFSEPVTGFASGDVTLGGTANPTTDTVTETAPNDGTTYDVAVSGMSGDGTITASISASQAQDAAGNGNNASTSTDNTVTYDGTAPTVTVEQAGGQLDPTGSSPIHFTVVFSEPVSGFASGDATLGGGANPTTDTVTEIAPNDGTTYDVAISGMGGDGTVTASIGANQAQDAAGNGNSASTSVDNSVVYDTVVPSVTIEQASGQADPTNASPIHFTVVFSEPVTGFINSDVTLSGTANPSAVNVTETAPNDGTTYDVAVSGMANDGTVTAGIPAGAAQDAANNDNTASTSTDDTVTYDTTAPTVTVEQASGQADPTKVSPVNFTAVFSEPVSGFASGDVTLGGTAGATTAAVTEIAPNDGTTYNVAVSGMTTGGTVTADIGASVAQDASGNDNVASTSTDNTVTFTFDTTTTITSDTPDPSLVGETVTFTYTVTVNSGSGTPTGNVTVSDGTNSCTDTVAAGSCTITFTTLGAKTLTATYAGDTYFNTSTSASVSHQVNNANTTTTITADAPDPSMKDDALTVTFSVLPVAPATGTPTGNVTVSDGVDSCVGTVASGSCSITLTTSGLRTLTATYAGDGNFGGSTSADESHTVNELPAITSPDRITFVVQVPGSFTVLSTGFPVSALSQTGALPGGVTFVDNGDGTATLSGTPDLGTSGDYPLTFTASNGTTDATQNFILTISVDPIFEDVPNDFWAAPYINAIYYAGITGGCSSNPLNYCPNAPITRAQIAVYVKRAIHGSSYQPPIPGALHFTDIEGHWAQNWIEDLYSEGITAGCGLTPFSYCPDAPVTRAQMAVFLLLLKNGSGYIPPTAQGTIFTDVPSDHWAAAWIEELAAEGITAGCGNGNYCPDAPVTRAEMAVLIVTALNLVLP